jgi:nitrite reductase/ring-hydroxylating ferredoxin subunit
MSSTQLVRVCSQADVPEGGCKAFIIGKRHVAVFRSEGKVFVTSNICSHEHESLADGWLDGTVIECPRHGAQFSIVSGEALSLPATEPIDVFAVTLEGDDIFVDLPAESPTA